MEGGREGDVKKAYKGKAGVWLNERIILFHQP